MVADFSKKRNKEFFNRNFWYRIAGISFVVAVLVLAVADFRIYQKKQQFTSQINAYQKQINDIRKSSQTLKDEIANADNKDYLEKLGYEQFNQTHPGETEYMFVKSQNSEQTNFTQKNSNTWLAKISSTWQNMLSWIKSKF